LLFPAEKTGRIMLKCYLDEQKCVVVGDAWNDIDQIRAAKSERVGYPAQKPEVQTTIMRSPFINFSPCTTRRSRL
jgi:beta-phosphoglucomutase-like phosphatase (HAD superfamily)